MLTKIRRLLDLSGLTEKLNEAVTAVVPIMAIVLALASTIVPMPTSILIAFLFGGLMLIFGMTMFSLGAEIAMGPIGSKMGAAITRTKKLWFILLMGFLLGSLITMSEPDLQVLAGQITSIPPLVLIVCVAVGTGLFLMLALLRTFLGIPLRRTLIISYAIVFILLAFAPPSFTAVAFDSGGVTTGPMTVPFIMAFGVGISSFRNDSSAKDDSFGIIALSSVGPILAVLILSIIYRPENATYEEALVPDIANSIELSSLFTRAIPIYFIGMMIAMLPIAVIFALFNIFALKLSYTEGLKTAIGLVYTLVGLVIFLSGVNVGFMPAGSCMGSLLASGAIRKWTIIPIGMLIGFFIVRAEPAVYVLMHQVEDITGGSVRGKTLQRALCIGVSVSVGLSFLRVLTGISILWIAVPGYVLALALSFKVPPIFTGIAFDSGGVASGPMTATFLLPFAMGACIQLGGNVVTDAFGVIALVAMTPLIAIQILGLKYRSKEGPAPVAAPVNYNNSIILDF